MTHVEMKQQLADYLEGDLPLETRARVDAHLDACPECALEVDEMQQTIRLLRLLPDPELPPMIAANVMRRIRTGEGQLSWVGRMGRALSSVLEPSFVFPASAVAAAALVAMIVREPGFLSRFIMDEEAVGETASPAAARRFDSGMAGIDLELTRAFGETAAEGPTRVAEPRRQISIEIPSILAWSMDSTRETQVFSVGDGFPGAGAFPVADARLAEGLAGGQGAVRYRFEVGGAGWPRDIGGVAGFDPSRVLEARPENALRTVRVAEGRAAEIGRMWHSAQPLRSESQAVESSGGEDSRDEWLARGIEDPVGFSRFLAGKSLAEQELWISRLAERAAARGLLEDLVRTLRTSGSTAAAALSDDFAAQIDLGRERQGEAGRDTSQSRQDMKPFETRGDDLGPAEGPPALTP